jgi:hypothetical protein
VLPGQDGHEVRNLRHAGVREKPREQDVRVGKVHLAVTHPVEDRRDLKKAAAFMIEEASEDRRRIEEGEAEEIDRAVHADERNGVHVSDDAEPVDRLVVHSHDVMQRGPDVTSVRDARLPRSRRGLPCASTARRSGVTL